MAGIYDYQGLCEDFLKQADSSGTTAQTRLSYRGNVLYSYNSQLARLQTMPSHGTMLFINNRIKDYSSTTARQTRILLSVNSYPVRYWNFGLSDEANINLIYERIDELIGKYERARVLKDVHKQFIHEYYHSLKPILNDCGIDKRTKLYKQYLKLPFKLFAHKLLKD